MKDPLPLEQIADRFWMNVQKGADSECWPWLAGKDNNGYGVYGIGYPHKDRAHRIAYQLLVGPIPAGLVIDHLCRHRDCANPAHMEVVTRGENVRRGVRPPKLICKNGHPRQPGQNCPECHRIANLNWWHRRQAFEVLDE